ncbi:metal-sensitive transcriptional regulator [Streptomyces sp. NPDC048717]|uniref:metal-sensitive transcriptional regulator n=1 Tax=unclassified Streptomyces TaxID=2593676 RepID=UPI003444E890
MTTTEAGQLTPETAVDAAVAPASAAPAGAGSKAASGAGSKAETIPSAKPANPTSPSAGSGEGHDHPVHGYHNQKDEHLKRLRRVEGQIRGLQRMVTEDTYCIDILTQVSASTKALQSFALQLLEEHLRHCVAEAAMEGGTGIEAKVEEATKAIARMMRT